jgi:chromosome segregation ATPase
MYREKLSEECSKAQSSTFESYKKELDDLNEKITYLINLANFKEEEIKTNSRVIELSKNLAAVNKDAIRYKNADDASKIKILKLIQSKHFLKDDMNYYKKQAKINLVEKEHANNQLKKIKIYNKELNNKIDLLQNQVDSLKDQNTEM